MTSIVRYTYRIRPGAIAERSLMAEWGRCRFLWNEAVHQQEIGNRPTFVRLSKLLTQARGELGWLKEGSRVAQQQTLRDYAQALGQSFTIKGRGRPKFKHRKTSLPSLSYVLPGFLLRDGQLVLPKVASIPVVWSRELPSTPTSVRVYQDSLGHWYASFVVRREDEPVPTVNDSIGIDWGVKTTATTTNPIYDLPYLGHRRRCAAELARAQRKMSRRKRTSRGYREARQQAARVHKRAARQNLHDGRVWAKAIVDNHQLIAVEDFRPRFLAKSTMARKSADAAIGIAKRELIERSKRAGRTVILVPAAYTTMTCSQCSARNKQRLKLSQRTFLCDACGYTADRDRNAARTILATAERNRAGVEDISLSVQPPGDPLEAV